MDDIITTNRTFWQKLPGIVELKPVVKPKIPKEDSAYPIEPVVSPCLLHDENTKGRYIALKSANDRQIVATGFTSTLAYKRAARKGFSSCIVIANHR